MDNNFINNNPLTPYLQPTVTQDEGIISIVADFDEARKKQAQKDSKRVYFTEDFKYLFAKLTDKDGKVNMATFELKQVPNPVPVTDAELSGKISELENGFNNRFRSIEDRLDRLMEYFVKERGANNGAS